MARKEDQVPFPQALPADRPHRVLRPDGRVPPDQDTVFHPAHEGQPGAVDAVDGLSAPPVRRTHPAHRAFSRGFPEPRFVFFRDSAFPEPVQIAVSLQKERVAVRPGPQPGRVRPALGSAGIPDQDPPVPFRFRQNFCYAAPGKRCQQRSLHPGFRGQIRPGFRHGAEPFPVLPLLQLRPAYGTEGFPAHPACIAVMGLNSDPSVFTFPAGCHGPAGENLVRLRSFPPRGGFSRRAVKERSRGRNQIKLPAPILRHVPFPLTDPRIQKPPERR